MESAISLSARANAFTISSLMSDPSAVDTASLTAAGYGPYPALPGPHPHHRHPDCAAAYYPSVDYPDSAGTVTNGYAPGIKAMEGRCHTEAVWGMLVRGGGVL